LRVRTLRLFFCSLSFLVIPASPALAVATGGVVAGGSTPSTSKTSTGASTPTPAIHTDPVTARTPNLAYKGPVYEKTPTGAVVPYQPATTTTSPTGQANPLTGGSPVGTAAGSPPAGSAAPGPVSTSAGGPAGKPELLVPGVTARYVDGLAAAPMSVPAVIQQIIWAGNQIIGLPYIFGGGHASFISPGYDCSGTVSFALHGAALLQTPEDSSEFEAWGSHGAGRWVAVFSNPGHAYMTVAGLRLDTSSADDPSNQQGPRWRPLRPGNPGFVVRHPLGL
jgi:cell wall-associated NlpC family hydrolase